MFRISMYRSRTCGIVGRSIPGDAGFVVHPSQQRFRIAVGNSGPVAIATIGPVRLSKNVPAPSILETPDLRLRHLMRRIDAAQMFGRKLRRRIRNQHQRRFAARRVVAGQSHFGTGAEIHQIRGNRRRHRGQRHRPITYFCVFAT